jgi:hypothetical protein
MVKSTIYFEKAGTENTLATFKAAEKRTIESGIRKLVLASTTENTARQALEYFKGKDFQIIVVPCQV